VLDVVRHEDNLAGLLKHRLHPISVKSPIPVQGCQMFQFHTKKSNLGKFWRALQWKMLVCFMAIWNISRPFFMTVTTFLVIWFIFDVLVSFTEKNLTTLFLSKNHCVITYAHTFPLKLSLAAQSIVFGRLLIDIYN
jgi:hypothetical protein